jgi:uncharacterized protein
MSAVIDRMRAGKKIAIGMVQLAPLPGSSMYKGGSLKDNIHDAIDEAKALADSGFDAIMVQNLGDLPVAHRISPSQLAWMSRIALEVSGAVHVPIGLNFLENDAEAILSVASAAGMDFVRLKVFVGVMVTPAGLVEGCAHVAIKARNLLGASGIGILADVHDRTGINLGGRDIDPDIREAIDLGGADGLVLTGSNFEESMDYIHRSKRKFPQIPVVLGGGCNDENLATTLAAADGVIISSALKDGNSAFGKINPEKAKRFMERFHKIG